MKKIFFIILLCSLFTGLYAERFRSVFGVYLGQDLYEANNILKNDGWKGYPTDKDSVTYFNFENKIEDFDIHMIIIGHNNGKVTNVSLVLDSEFSVSLATYLYLQTKYEFTESFKYAVSESEEEVNAMECANIYGIKLCFVYKDPADSRVMIVFQ